MTRVPFYKMEASGNDFVIIDNRKGEIRDPKAFGRTVCAWHRGIGADGVLFIEPSDQHDFFLRIVNADGSEAEACGNGYRCVGRFAHEVLGLKPKMTFDTLAGPVTAEMKKKSVKVQMVQPQDLREGISLTVQNRTFETASINTGVPHVVIWTKDLANVQVKEWGRAIRFHEKFQPKGTNVNFVQLAQDGLLQVRTYERGVEDETLACGTGSVAAAVTAWTQKKASSPVYVETRSGEHLIIHIESSGSSLKKVFLEGSAQFVFEGKILMEALRHINGSHA